MSVDSSYNLEAVEQLVWASNTVALGEQPIIEPTSWVGAVQVDLARFGVTAPLNASRTDCPAYLNAALVMMAKDEADIIGENLTWHYSIGVRRFLFLDNNSSDATATIIDRFRRLKRDAEIVVLDDPIVRYMQAEKTTGLYRLAISIWPDIHWILPTDADEFLVAERGLAVLDEVDNQVDALSIAKVVHFRARGVPYSGSCPMDSMTIRSPVFVVPPKVIVRHNLFSTITQGNHKVRMVDDRPPVYLGAFGLGLYYREFPTRSFDQFLRKIRNGGPAIRAAEDFLGRKVGGEHWMRYYDQLMSGGEEHLLEIYTKDWIRDPGNGFVVDRFKVDSSELH